MITSTRRHSPNVRVMENRQKAELLKRITENEGLPSLSPLVIQLVELAADDDSSVRDLAAIIEKDSGLTTRLLRLVGSAFFSQPMRVTSLSHAVVLLGFKRVRIMALSLSLRDTFPMGKRDGMDYDHFWKTSLYRALIAQDFAQSAPVSHLDAEEVFIAALILEIGMLMLYQVSSDEMKGVFPGGNLPLEKVVSWEETHLGVNHREVGRLIFQRWRFSDYLVASQKWFGAEALKPDRPAICKVVELARRLTEIVFGETRHLYALQQEAESLLRISHETVNDALSRTFNKVEELAEQLRIQVDSQTDVVRVMEKANQALARINTSMENSFRNLIDQVNQYNQSSGHMSEETGKSRRDILQNTLDAVAHEIRNPLLAVGGFARRLAMQSNIDERGRRYAEIIAKESARLEKILKEMIEFSQTYEPDIVETDLIPVIDKVLNEFEKLFHEKKIDIFRNFPQDPVPVPVDMDGISRVLRQLLSNAVIMLSADAGAVTVSLIPLRDVREICVSISHTGKALPDEIRDALIDSNLSTKTFGAGLGVPLTRKIIEAHNGRIELEDRNGNGITLRFYLPMSKASEPF